MPPPSRELLPELISDILLRLPAKPLLRFRCLSNSHRDEIDSSNFAQIHLKRSIETRSHRKLILSNRNDYYAADFDEGLKTAIKFNNQFLDRKRCYLKIINSCHGLILYYVKHRNYGAPNLEPKPAWELFLWNPSTRQIKKLPHCPGETPSRQGFCCGLGYDSASGDYKVVRIIADEGYFPNNPNFEPKRVWVFSLKSNSWRWTQDLYLNNLMFPSPNGFANGFLYWIYLIHGGDIKVGCFDLASEEFFTIPSFCSAHDGGLLDRDVGVEVLEGNVIMHIRDWKAKAIEFHSPVVGGEDRGGLPGGNWSKMFTFQLEKTDSTRLSGIPLAYSKDGACVLLKTKRKIYWNNMEKRIFWYNMEKKTRHGVNLLRGMSTSESDNRFNNCCVIWESLISLGNDGVFQL